MAIEREPTVAIPALVLPSDINDVTAKTFENEDHTAGLSLTVKRQAPLLGYVMLAAAICGISVLGSA